ncbi:MAG: SUF system NifU family Fe-S cluster assembly protein [Bifidobacteriaceae bacterium]|nr:SUF system NifU family Fe-S cluster assembly protein [Bifidobacteriaceae bacterium]
MSDGFAFDGGFDNENDEPIDTSLQQMYQEIILDASRRAYGQRADLVEDTSQEDDSQASLVARWQSHPGCFVGQSHQFNPTCGDEVLLRVEAKDGVIKSVEWNGHGCAISTASLSIMCELIEDRTIDEFTRLYQAFRKLMDSRGRGVDEPTKDLLGDVVAFQSVSRFPMRIKCALLGWEAVKASLAQVLLQSDKTSAAGTNKVMEVSGSMMNDATTASEGERA